MISKTKRLQEYRRLQVVSYGINHAARPFLLFFSSKIDFCGLDRSYWILFPSWSLVKYRHRYAVSSLMDTTYWSSEQELEVELNKYIDWDEVIDHVHKKAKEDNAIKRYQALKRKPQTEAQAGKNMTFYLKNVAGFKMDYFKGMSYDDIRPIFEQNFNSNVAFLLKTKEQIDEEKSRALKRLNESQEDKALKKQNLDEENKPYYKIKRADSSHQLYMSFLSLLRNFDREDLEALWRLVKERFATTKPKNFSNDFVLITLGAMFKKPDLQAQIWKNQRSVHGQAKVKSWKLLESCGVQIITFTPTQLILLVKRRYPLTRFTLDQMLNNVRLEVEEESEVSLELLSFGVDAAEESQGKHAK
nr:hypothetical protein [Tanacetum cinerariifolium]